MKNSDCVLLRRVVGLSWPVILEMSGVMMAGALMTAMVGRLGAVELAAVGIATMTQLASAMVVAAFGTGASAIVGRESGAGLWEDVRQTAGQALLLGLLIGMLVACVGFLGARSLLVRLIGAEPAVAALAGELLKILFLFTPALLMMSIANAVLRGIAKTRTAFFIATFSNVLSILLSYALIYGVAAPPLGVAGVAWGTGVAQLAGGLTALAVVRHDPHIRLRWQNIAAWQPVTIKKILRISLPAAMEQAALQGGRVTFTFMLTGLGAVQFAAHQIAMQVESLSFLPGFGFSVGIMTLVAQSLGKKRYRQAERLVRTTGWLAVVSMTLMAAVFLLFAKPLTTLFIADPEVVYWGTFCVMLAAFEQPTIGVSYVLAGALRGAGDTRWPMVVTTIGVWIFRLPAIYLSIRFWGGTIVSVWMITAVDFLIRSLILWWRFRKGDWKQLS